MGLMRALTQLKEILMNWKIKKLSFRISKIDVTKVRECNKSENEGEEIFNEIMAENFRKLRQANNFKFSEAQWINAGRISK